MEEHRLCKEHAGCMKLEYNAAGRIAHARLTAMRVRVARGAAGANRQVVEGVARIIVKVPTVISKFLEFI